MKPLNYLCISDTHLGEDASLLNEDEGLDTLGGYLKEIAPNGVKNLVLAGDITDAVLASKEMYLSKTKAFIQCLADNIPYIKKITFMFGNHDLSLFREIMCSGSSNSKFFLHGLSADSNPDVQSLKDLLVPSGLDIRFQIANPLYVTQSERKVYVFHHGHHLRKDIHKCWGLFKYGNAIGLVQTVTGNDLEFGNPSPDKAETLEEFESCTFPLVTTLWKNEYDEAVPPEEQFWRYVHKVTKHFDERSLEQGLHALKRKDLPRIEKFSRDLIFKRYLHAIIKSRLVSVSKEKEISFIYGDTHDGGYETKKVLGRKANIFNTGAWVTYDDNYHPHCLIYTASANDQEKMYECGFNASYVNQRSKSMKKVKGPKLGLLEEELIKRIWGNLQE